MSILNSVVSLWEKQLACAERVKKREFMESGERAWAFLGKNDYHDLYMKQGSPAYREGNNKHPWFKARRNLTAEYVKVMLPYIHHKVPHRLVSPDRPDLPPELFGLPAGTAMTTQVLQTIDPQRALIGQQDHMRAWLMEWMLNYTPRETNLRYECRQSVTEALVMGRGVVWHEMTEGSYGEIPGSFFVSVRDLLIDPDAEQLRDAAWIARRRRRSVWQVADEYGLDRKELRGQYRSHRDRAGEEPEGSTRTEESSRLDEDGKNGDVIEYFEVYSLAGLGQKFDGASTDLMEVESAIAGLDDAMFLVICPGVDYPLNLPPHLAASPNAAQEIMSALEWPIPFWHDKLNPWPFSALDFYPNTENPWASSPIEAATSLQQFIDRAYGFLMDRIWATSRQFPVMSRELGVQFRNLLAEGADQQIIDVLSDEGGEVDIRKQFGVLEFKPVITDLWNILALAERAYEKATGTGNLIHGEQPGTEGVDRSAAGAQIRQGNLLSRPEDMAECAEQWQAEIARAEGFMCRVLVKPETVSPLFGEQMSESPQLGPQMGPLTQLWGTLVNAPPEVAVAEVSYTIESGSGRRKNQQKKAADAEILMQTLFGPLLEIAATGNVAPVNALIDMLGDAYDIKLENMKIPPPPMMPPGAPPQPGAPPPPGVPPQPGV